MKTETKNIRRRPARNANGTFRADNTAENISKTILDLAQRIEQRGRERFIEKSENLRTRILDIFRSHYPHSNDETLVKLALASLLEIKPDQDVVLAEIRELNIGMVVASEREVVPCPISEPGEK